MGRTSVLRVLKSLREYSQYYFCAAMCGISAIIYYPSFWSSKRQNIEPDVVLKRATAIAATSKPIMHPPEIVAELKKGPQRPRDTKVFFPPDDATQEPKTPTPLRTPPPPSSKYQKNMRGATIKNPPAKSFKQIRKYEGDIIEPYHGNDFQFHSEHRQKFAAPKPIKNNLISTFGIAPQDSGTMTDSLLATASAEQIFQARFEAKQQPENQESNQPKHETGDKEKRIPFEHPTPKSPAHEPQSNQNEGRAKLNVIKNDDDVLVIKPWNTYKIDNDKSNYLRFWIMQLARQNAPQDEIPFRVALINTLLSKKYQMSVNASWAEETEDIDMKLMRRDFVMDYLRSVRWDKTPYKRLFLGPAEDLHQVNLDAFDEAMTLPLRLGIYREEDLDCDALDSAACEL